MKKEEKNMKKRNIVLVLLVVILATALTGCGTSKKEYREKISKLQQENAELEEKLEKTKKEGQKYKIDAIKKEVISQKYYDYLNKKFYTDGNYYKIASDTTMYKDTSCEEEVDSSSIKVLSPVVDEFYMKNGNGVAAILTEQGILYSNSCPNLEIDEDY